MSNTVQASVQYRIVWYSIVYYDTVFCIQSLFFFLHLLLEKEGLLVYWHGSLGTVLGVSGNVQEQADKETIIAGWDWFFFVYSHTILASNLFYDTFQESTVNSTIHKSTEYIITVQHIYWNHQNYEFITWRIVSVWYSVLVHFAFCTS